MSDNDFIDADPWAALDADSFTPTPPESTPEEPVTDVTESAVPDPPAVPGPPPAPAPEPDLEHDLEQDIESIEIEEPNGDVSDIDTSALADAADPEGEGGLDLGDFDLDDLDMGALESDPPLLDSPASEIIDLPAGDVDFDEISATLAEVDGISEDVDATVVDAEDLESDVEVTETPGIEELDSVIAELDDLPEPGELAETSSDEMPSTPRSPMSSFLAGSGLFESSSSPSSTPDMAESEAQDALEPDAELESVMSDLEEQTDLGDLPAAADIEFDSGSVPSAYKELESLGVEEGADTDSDAPSSVEITDENAQDPDELADPDSPTMDDIDFSSLETDDSASEIEPDQPDFAEPESSIEMGDIDFTSLETPSVSDVEASEIADEDQEDGDSPVFGAVLGEGDRVTDDESDDLDLGVSFGFAGDEPAGTTSEPTEQGSVTDDSAMSDISTDIEGIDLSSITGSAIEFTDLADDVASTDVLPASDDTIEDATDSDINVELEGDVSFPEEDATSDDEFSALAAMVADVEPTVPDSTDPTPVKETDELSWLDDDLKSDVMPPTGAEAADESVDELIAHSEETVEEATAESSMTNDAAETDDFEISADPFSLASPVEPPPVDESPPIDIKVETETTEPVLSATSDLEVPDLEVPDLDIMNVPAVGPADIDADSVEADHEGKENDGAGVQESPVEASMWSGDVASETGEQPSDDTWGIKWTESRQGWIDDESGQQLWRPIVTTSQELSDFAIDEYLGVVFGDTTVSLATASSMAIADARDTASQSMVAEAMTRGAHAVIAASITVQTVGSNVMVSSSGTAVALKAKVVDPPTEEPA